MRFQLAAMALSLAVLSRHIQIRAAAAFTIGTTSQTRIRSFTTSNKLQAPSNGNGSSNEVNSRSRRARRIRPKHTSDSLNALLEDRERLGIPLHLSAVETVNGVANGTGDSGSDNDDISSLFPQKGKSIEDCAPRMRFAPSPTGR